MSELYSALRVSPKKKRVYTSDEDDTVLTPKRKRIMARTPPATPKRAKSPPALPAHLSRFQTLQRSLHRALSHSLATAAVSPSDSGVVPNVLNHLNLTSALGLTRACSLDDIKRLCWLWEWKGDKLPEVSDEEEDENPFFDKTTSESEQPKQWTRGGSGLVITPTTYLPKSGGKRVPAYGIGIEVEMDLDKEMVGGMAAVARWTASGDHRMKELTKKLERWVELHPKSSEIPNVPQAELPQLTQPVQKQSALTQRLVSHSPKSPKTATPSRTSKTLEYPPSPTRTSPSKSRIITGRSNPKEFAIPFPITPSSISRHKSTATPIKGIPFPLTPSSIRIASSVPSTPRTPRTSLLDSDPISSRPSTPVHQTGSDAKTVPSTPSTERRSALYERVRKRSEAQVPATPSKARIATSSKMTRDELLKLSQEEMRRRCLLGRLGHIAESVWMYFVAPSSSSSLTATPRKRRTHPSSDVANAIIKSSSVPISAAEAQESISLLTSLCPFFLKKIDIGGEEWLEMPASLSGTQQTALASSSRNGKGKEASNNSDLKSLSPRRVKPEAGGLREVRERIKRELDATE